MSGSVPSSSSYTDEDENNLKQLLEVFGSSVSLEDIASAYIQAHRNIDDTSEILCGTEHRTSSSNNLPEVPDVPKIPLKRISASMGTVSGVIGKEYVTSRPRTNKLPQKQKPIKLNSDEFPASELWEEKEEPKSASESMNSDMEEFLFEMLGSGFRLEMSVIHDVVGQCGYDITVSVDKLLDLSAATLETSRDVNDGNNFPKHAMKATLVNSPNEQIKPVKEKKKKNDLQKEILESLFSVPNFVEEKSEITRPLRPTQKPSPYGQPVTKPLEDTIVEDFVYITRQSVNSRDAESSEHDYEGLRKAAKEHWVTMKGYFKAAVEAYAKGDQEKAYKLLDEGHFYMSKAREADEISTQKLVEDSGNQEEYLINVHIFDPKDAVEHLKLNLTSLSGFPSITYLKVVVGTDGVDKKDARRKRLVTKLLEKEGIAWSEEGNGWTISIKVDEIDPNKFSFADK